MAKNNQKKEKAARNREYARKFRKKLDPKGRRRGPAGPRPSASPGSGVGPGSAGPSVAPPAAL